MPIEVTTHGPLLATALGWPGRPSMTTVVVRATGRVEGARAQPIAPSLVGGLAEHPSTVAARGAERLLFKQGCELGIIGAEADDTGEVRTLELIELAARDGGATIARIVAAVGRPLAPTVAPATGPVGEARASVADDQLLRAAHLPLRVLYARRGLACDVTVAWPAPDCWVRADGRCSQVDLRLDGIWLDPLRGHLELTFRGTAFMPTVHAASELAVLVVAAPRGEGEATIRAFRAGAVGGEEVSDEEVGATTVVLAGDGEHEHTVSLDGAPPPPAAALPFSPLDPRGGPNVRIGASDAAPPQPWRALPVPAAHHDLPPEIAASAPPHLEPVALHRRVQQLLWARPEDVDAILSAHGLDPVSWRVLKRRLTRRG